ncbi:MAG: acyl-CoA synthetase FdrA [Anaerolineae bacterium]|nr:acyl-CoA synthetase FdrA [Anaerolineae bacterium]
MASGFLIRKNQYYDSVFLMGVNRRISEVKGVQQSAVLMGSQANKELLAAIGIRDAQIDAAQPNDLVVAIVAETPQIVEDVLGRLDEWLQPAVEGAPVSARRSLEDGLASKPNANLAVISVPGEYAAREARKALEAGLNVFLFSSNVPIEEELRLKELAARRGLIVMGPDCGTGLIGGVGLGFANAVRRGPIGVIGAAGTGLQEFTCQVHNAGYGISHAIGTGSRDLSDQIGGITALTALDALENDPQTRVIAIISKPPGTRTLERLIERFKGCRKPIIGCFLGVRGNLTDSATAFRPAPHIGGQASTIDEAVQLAIAAVGGEPAALPTLPSAEEQEWVVREKAGWAPGQRYLRGLFAGGTFCYQTQQILQDAGIPAHSNAPLVQARALAHPDQSREHTVVDMGDEYYTTGRPHPMIDGTLRRQRIVAESRDPQVAVLLLDFILGYGASMDPVGELYNAIVEAQQTARRRGGALTVVASICGTDGDPQDLALQTRLLKEAGAIVFPSSARAALFCCRLLRGD